MLNRRRMRQSRIGSAKIFRYLRMQHRETFNMQFVNYRLMPWDAQLRIVAPVKVRIDYHALRDERRAVAIIAAQVFVRMTNRIAKQCIVPAEEPVDRLGVWINQQLGRIETLPAIRIVRPVHPIAISQARLGPLQIDMPAGISLLGNSYSVGLAILAAIVIEAQLHAGRVFAEQRKVNPRPVPVRTLRIGIPGHRSHRTVHRSKTPRPSERNRSTLSKKS